MELAELEALAAKATPGPWLDHQTKRPNSSRHWREIIAEGTSLGEIHAQFDADPPVTEADADANIALIVTLVNAVPAIIEALAAVKERDELRKVVGVMSDCIDVADRVIAVNCGIDTPREWNAAVCKVVTARQALAGQP